MINRLFLSLPLCFKTKNKSMFNKRTLMAVGVMIALVYATMTNVDLVRGWYNQLMGMFNKVTGK